MSDYTPLRDGTNALASVEIFMSVFADSVFLYNGPALTLNQAAWSLAALPISNFVVFAGGLYVSLPSIHFVTGH